ncbi:MAG: hypothetical protein IJ875_01730, partial [Solobacterium sp.]|nr:hypothetical protein [Solobacterium sp.]
PQQPSGLGALFGGNSYNSSYGNNSIMNILSQFVGGGYNQYPQANSLYNIFSNASQNAFNQSGSLNVSSLFSLLNTLMRG